MRDGDPFKTFPLRPNKSFAAVTGGCAHQITNDDFSVCGNVAGLNVTPFGPIRFSDINNALSLIPDNTRLNNARPHAYECAAIE